MNPHRYLQPAMTAQRRKALAWILAARASASGSLMAHRPRNSRLSHALVLIKDTPQAIARAWNTGSLPATIAQTGIAACIGLAFGCMFGLAI